MSGIEYYVPAGDLRVSWYLGKKDATNLDAEVSSLKQYIVQSHMPLPGGSPSLPGGPQTHQLALLDVDWPAGTTRKYFARVSTANKGDATHIPPVDTPYYVVSVRETSPPASNFLRPTLVVAPSNVYTTEDTDGVHFDAVAVARYST